MSAKGQGQGKPQGQGKRPFNGGDDNKSFGDRFLKIFSSHVNGACRQADFPGNPKFIMFGSSEPLRFDAKTGKPFKYKSAHLGQVVILTDEQIQHITEYLGLNRDPFAKGGKPEGANNAAEGCNE